MARGVRGTTIAVEGLADLIRDFGKMDKSLKREVQKELRELAKMVATTGQRIASGKGLAPPGTSGRGTGRELRGIKPFYRGATAGVRSSAANPRDGFAYPLRHEYEAGGRRAYLGPALDEDSQKVEDGLGDMIDRVSSIGFGRGGKL